MKLLIVRTGAMGDVVHALHAAAALRAAWLRAATPDCVIDWVVDPRWLPLLQGIGGGEGDVGAAGPVVRRVHLADTKLWKRGPLRAATLRSIATLRREVREEPYDVVVDLQGTLRSAIIGRLARAQRYAGWADPREPLAARLYRRTEQRSGVHVVEQMTALLGAAAGVELTNPGGLAEECGVVAREGLARTGLEITAGDGLIPKTGWAEMWAADEGFGERGPLAVLSAGGGWGAKLWPAAKFAALAGRLRAQGFDVVVNAARADDVEARAVAEASGGAARVVVCNVAGLIALLRRARLCIGGDTGPVHVAAALSVPVVALFGPTDPARNGPRGAGPVRVLRGSESVTSYRRVNEVDAGLAQIEVEELLGACEEVVRL